MGTGNTPISRSLSVRVTVHPRGHGEHLSGNANIISVDGSSPWARGTLVFNNCGRTAARFIPVGTGNTCVGRFHPDATAVHPRGHGEHLDARLILFIAGGSSPWARGTPITLHWFMPLTRFIPVGTGNTFTFTPTGLSLAVHPRGHGEHDPEHG